MVHCETVCTKHCTVKHSLHFEMYKIVARQDVQWLQKVEVSSTFSATYLAAIGCCNGGTSWMCRWIG